MKSLVLLFAIFAALPAFAAEKDAVGYGGKKVQMMPIMAPYRTSEGIRYQVLNIRLALDKGPKEHPACFSIPIVHDKFVRYLYQANLTQDDFDGERRQVLQQKLFEVAVATVGRGFYTGAQILGNSPEEMDPQSSAKAKSTAKAKAKAKTDGGAVKPDNDAQSDVDLTLSNQCK